jgi:hypothetical protein
MITYITQASFYERGMESLLNYLKLRNLPHHDVKIIPFSHEMYPDLELKGNVVYFGSYGMRDIALKKNWYPACEFDLEEKSQTLHNGPWLYYLLNEICIICDFKDVLDATPMEEFFMRPIADSKVFAGKIFNRKYLREWIYGIHQGDDNGSGLVLTTSVAVAPILNIESEYRFFIIGDEIVTYSQYKHRGRVKYNAEVPIEIVNACIDLIDINPNFASAYCLDLCMSEGKIKIVEVNSLPCSGFYECDVTKIIDKLQRVYG